MAMVQLLPSTASGCHPQSQGTVEEEEENEMRISHVSLFAGPFRVLVLLFLLSAGFPQAQQQDTPCEVSWSHSLGH